MNRVNSLLKTPFLSLEHSEKLEIRKLGAYQPRDFKIFQEDGKRVRKFSFQWFEKKEWLTVNDEKQALFCFYCLLYGGETLWTQIGCKDLKHLSEKIKKHESSVLHMNNAVRFKTFGNTNIVSQRDDGYRLSIRKHNELVDKKRHVLKRIIDCLKFCGAHELSPGHNEMQGSLDRDVLLDMLSYMASLDSVLKDHLDNATMSGNTPTAIQNELLDCIYQVYVDEIKAEIKNVQYVSMQVDEITDLCCQSQFSIILRYMKESRPVERIIAFAEVQNRTAEGLSSVLKDTLQQFGLKDKHVAQSYDGAPIMADPYDGVHVRMREHFLHASHVHSYTHHMDLVLKKVCSGIKRIRIFFANISGISSFFTASPKRSSLLGRICHKGILTVLKNGWNFYSKVIDCIAENRKELLEYFERIQDERFWDDKSICESTGFRKLLEDGEFVFFLSFFEAIFQQVDVLYNALQARTLTGVHLAQALNDFDSTAAKIAQALQNFDSAIREIHENITYHHPEPITNGNEESSLLRKRIKIESNDTAEADAKEACNIILNQMKERFEESTTFRSFVIVDPECFKFYKKHFPFEHKNAIAKHYPMLNEERLSSELSVIYGSDAFRNIPSVCALMSFLHENKLLDTFPEVSKLLEIVLVTPVSTGDTERCFNTLNRMKTFLRNSSLQGRLTPLAVLSVHKEYIAEIPRFNQKVIDKFASKENRRDQYLYK